jgi:hypothetical protein
MYLFPLTAHLATPHVRTLHSRFPFDHVQSWTGDADDLYGREVHPGVQEGRRIFDSEGCLRSLFQQRCTCVDLSSIHSFDAPSSLRGGMGFFWWISLSITILERRLVLLLNPGFLISCSAAAERANTAGSFNAVVTLFLTLRRYPEEEKAGCREKFPGGSSLRYFDSEKREEKRYGRWWDRYTL